MMGKHMSFNREIPGRFDSSSEKLVNNIESNNDIQSRISEMPKSIRK
jgi:hypothetical protein